MGYDHDDDHGKGVGGDPEPGTQKRKKIYLSMYKHNIFN